jgi:hypothetical protein
MLASCGAGSARVEPVEEHGEALLTESPITLRRRRWRDIVRQDEVEPRRTVGSPLGADAQIGLEPAEEHDETLLTESPLILRCIRRWHIMG